MFWAVVNICIHKLAIYCLYLYRFYPDVLQSALEPMVSVAGDRWPCEEVIPDGLCLGPCHLTYNKGAEAKCPPPLAHSETRLLDSTSFNSTLPFPLLYRRCTRVKLLHDCFDYILESQSIFCTSHLPNEKEGKCRHQLPVHRYRSIPTPAHKHLFHRSHPVCEALM